MTLPITPLQDYKKEQQQMKSKVSAMVPIFFVLFLVLSACGDNTSTTQIVTSTTAISTSNNSTNAPTSSSAISDVTTNSKTSIAVTTSLAAVTATTKIATTIAVPSNPIINVPGDILSLAFSQDGKTLVTLSGKQDNAIININNLMTGQSSQLNGKGGSKATLSPDGKFLATIGFFAPLSIWDLQAQKKVDDFQIEQVSILTFSPDSKTIAVGTGDGTIKVLDFNRGSNCLTFR